MVRSLLRKRNIPNFFFLEAVNCCVHVLNISPTFFVKNMTHEEAWSGWKPTIDRFRIFDCIAYAHIPYEKMKKIDDRSEKCVFLGVIDVSKAYKLFNPITNKIVTSRDIILMKKTFGIRINNSLLQPFLTMKLKNIVNNKFQ